MRKTRYFYLDELYNFRKQWYKKKLGTLGEKEVKKQLEVLLMYEYYHIGEIHYIDKKTMHWTVKYRTLEMAADRVKKKLSGSHSRLGNYDKWGEDYRVKQWYETHKHLLKLQ